MLIWLKKSLKWKLRKYLLFSLNLNLYQLIKDSRDFPFLSLCLEDSRNFALVPRKGANSWSEAGEFSLKFRGRAEKSLTSFTDNRVLSRRWLIRRRTWTERRKRQKAHCNWYNLFISKHERQILKVFTRNKWGFSGCGVRDEEYLAWSLRSVKHMWWKILPNWVKHNHEYREGPHSSVFKVKFSKTLLVFSCGITSYSLVAWNNIYFLTVFVGQESRHGFCFVLFFPSGTHGYNPGVGCASSIKVSSGEGSTPRSLWSLLTALHFHEWWTEGLSSQRACGWRLPTDHCQLCLSSMAACFIKVHVEKSKGGESSKMEVTALII